MVRIDNVHFSYRRGDSLFSGLELELPSGTIAGLLGRNGAGKTTMLRILAGLLYPHSGNAFIGGVSTALRRPGTLQEIFFLPEDFYLPSLPMKRYVDVHAPFYPRFDPVQLREGLDELEVPFGVHLGRISYGQKKKFLIAFGLATGARLLLLDEPTNGLDIPAKSRLRRLLIGNLRADRSFLISTHQVRDLAAILDPVVILDGGRILLHQDMAYISSRIACTVVPEEPVAGSVLWHERVPGGYAVLERNRTGSEANVDVEMLFNAVIQRDRDLLQLLATEGER